MDIFKNPIIAIHTFGNVEFFDDFWDNQQRRIFQGKLFKMQNQEAKVLVLTPDYPSVVSHYACTFVHTRVKHYKKNNLKADVVVFNDFINDVEKRTYDGIDILSMNYRSLKKFLFSRHYDVVICHFFNEFILQILYARCWNSKIVLINHGYESQIEEMKNIQRPYFSPVLSLSNDWQNSSYYFYYKQFAISNNVHWVFVSNWLKQTAESTNKVVFKHAHVIPNYIDEEIFKFIKPHVNDRKRILVVKKFNNCQQYAVDQIVLSILELSRRSIFQDLQFDIYGNGDAFDLLIAPLRQFKNVRLHKNFIPNHKIPEIVMGHGLLLAPTRYDSQGVTICEIGSCGCLPITTNICAIGETISEHIDDCVVEPEQYSQIADAVEYFYNNPQKFLDCVEKVSDILRGNFCADKTILKEIGLIKSLSNTTNEIVPVVQAEDNTKILTIIVAAYNVEAYLDKCIRTLLNVKNRNLLEILIINDGSKDATLQIARNYERDFKQVVRVINKQNAGHGSVINCGIINATGKYLQIVDGDDWVDSANLEQFIDRLVSEDADLVINPASYDYTDNPAITNIVSYGNLKEGVLYKFDDLTYQNYGLQGFNPRLPTSTYKVDCLRKGDFKLSENCRYVDMEFNTFAISGITTAVYYDLNMYRYLIGREGQSVSIESWKRFWPNHLHVVKRLMNYIGEVQASISPQRCKYLQEHLIFPMMSTQVYIFDQLRLRKEMDSFLEYCSQRPHFNSMFLEYVKSNDPTVSKILFNSDSTLDLKCSKRCLSRIKLKLNEILALTRGVNSCRRLVKMLLPYGIVRIIQVFKK